MKNNFLTKIGICLCIGCGAPLQAQKAGIGDDSSAQVARTLGRPANPNAMTDGIAGLLINNMVTPNGNQFFQLFGMSWQESPDAEVYSLRLVETISRRSGSQVYIYAGNRLLFAGGLPYKSSQLRLVVDQAIEAIGTRLISDAMESASSDQDLGKEEL